MCAAVWKSTVRARNNVSGAQRGLLHVWTWCVRAQGVFVCVAVYVEMVTGATTKMLDEELV